MARNKWTENYFRKGLKAERERRELTQPELAELFKQNGLPMHWTTIAKIESGNRSVRIDEAVQIAEIFGTTVDGLLGFGDGRRRKAAVIDDLAFKTGLLVHTAREGRDQARQIARSIADRAIDVRQVDPEDRTRELRDQCEEACLKLVLMDEILTNALQNWTTGI